MSPGCLPQSAHCQLPARPIYRFPSETHAYHLPPDDRRWGNSRRTSCEYPRGTNNRVFKGIPPLIAPISSEDTFSRMHSRSLGHPTTRIRVLKLVHLNTVL